MVAARQPQSATPCTPAGTSPAGWRAFLPVIAFVAFFHAVAAAVLLPAGLPVDCWPTQEGYYLASLLLAYVSAPLLLHLAFGLAGDMGRSLRGRSTASLGARFSRCARLLLWGWPLALLYAIAQIAYVNLKTAVPLLNPVTWDGVLESVERTLCGGLLPTQWLVAHSSLAALCFWEGVYYLFTIMLFVSLAIVLSLEGPRGGARLILALVVGLLLDVLITLACPTRGPLFMHPEWFDGLDTMPSLRLAAFLMHTVNHYADQPGEIYALGGISAMPSYHVYAWTCAYFCWRPLHPWLRALGLILVVLNWASTVVLGWHYALDGVAAFVLAAVVWWWSGRVIPRDRASPRD